MRNVADRGHQIMTNGLVKRPPWGFRKKVSDVGTLEKIAFSHFHALVCLLLKLGIGFKKGKRGEVRQI